MGSKREQKSKRLTMPSKKSVRYFSIHLQIYMGRRNRILVNAINANPNRIQKTVFYLKVEGLLVDYIKPTTNQY